MKIVSQDEVLRTATKTLGVESCAPSAETVEFLAASFRRVAGISCPCTPRTLLETVLAPLEGFIADQPAVRIRAEETLDALISYGDLLEQKDVSLREDAPKRLLYVAPPAFVSRKSGTFLLVGIAPEHNSPLPKELAEQVRYSKHTRVLVSAANDLETRLIELGLRKLSNEAWLKPPPGVSPLEFLGVLQQRLRQCLPVSDIPDLSIIDPNESPRYYRGRWTSKPTGTGCFVGRRPQAYGADIWCYVELHNGRPLRFLDLPSSPGRWRGYDEAWRLQAAIDTEKGHPQMFRVRQGPVGFMDVDFFSPVPSWAKRRWDSVGDAVSGEGLFSYRFAAGETAEEVQFAEERLWLRQET